METMSEHITRIESHCPELKCGMPQAEAFKIIADQLDKYKAKIEEQDRIIVRLTESSLK